MAKHSEDLVELGAESIQALADSLGHNIVVSSFEEDLDLVLSQMKDLLMAKNAAYGDSALNLVRVHSTADPTEQIKVRMDDKLSRMLRGQLAGEDAALDYVGYYFMLKIAELREESE